MILGMLLILMTILSPIWQNQVFYVSPRFSTILVAGLMLFLLGAALARFYWIVLVTAMIILCLHVFDMLPIRMHGVGPSPGLHIF